MLILGKAELVKEDANRKLNSASQSFKWPSVIRLKNYIRVPRINISPNKKNILKRDNYTCAYCGAKGKNLTIDHILPKSRGGEDTWQNLITSCHRCNNRKGDRLPEEAEMTLLYNPYKPNYILFIKNILGKVSENWRPFLFE